MKKFFEEFKEFINQGNVMDLAVAVVIGAAFTAIVNSVVSDLIMPLISLVTGGVNFSDMKISLGSGPDAAAFTYGNFINAVIQFVIIAFVVFLIVKAMNQARMFARRGKHAEEMDAPHCPYCLEEVAEGATRCPHCTSELPAPAAPTPKA
ncbi:large conductance mechanosensitive channel protein MscL [Eggerthella sinensis]|uniref:Large-conductance mechanosensitive channel n=1 Tax=Eggerthella sinensis TaxID=242230 RepID=A0A3N0IP71_9ACTN|nr:large conductance mechanosensitive channel protein MscL [Eggerthella sinensis]RDB67585.1 large conductance mechanosensitive channel protein MscL [Eggerthella sinensis]RNM38803.1 large conductance mechanosensitive channel protein MscL [Eggerthella sinensis]